MGKLNKNNGITLIALVITIIVLLILAGITISLTIGQDGILKMAEQSGENYVEAAEYERDQLEELTNTAESIIENNEEIKNNSIIGKISQIQTSGFHKINIKDSDKEIEYSLDVIVVNGDLVLDGINTVNGSRLNDNIYEFGNEQDVATENTDAKNMVVLKVNGSITINEGVTLTSCKSDDGYGGPKGMLIYCTKILNNNGTISMTARGAKAEGEDVYLWQNTDESYEIVEAQGASGGATVTTKSSGNYWTYSSGNNGNDALGRQTGGGGSRVISQLWSYWY